MEGRVGRGGRRWGKEGGLEWRFEGGFGQVQGSLGRWEGRGRWGRGEGGGEVRGGFKAERGRGRGRDVRFEREKLLSLSSKEGEGGKRLSSLTISNEKEVTFGKNLGSASSKKGGETIEKGYLTTSSMSKKELENMRILRKREKRKE